MNRFNKSKLQNLVYFSAIIVASLLVTLIYALTRGQDLNWDQRNYHISMPFFLKNGSYWTSVAPSGIHSYFNPYVYQIQYFGITHLPPILFTTLLATAQSTVFMIAGLICLDIARPAGRDTPGAGNIQDLAPALCGFALCLMAPIALSEAGATFIDLLTAAPVVAAYGLLLVRGRRLGLFTTAALAGALIGLATALKLTNAVFAIGAIGFALAGHERLRQRLQWLVAYAASGLLSFLVIGGGWLLQLWTRFKNPFFPYYNNIFRSPDFGVTTERDIRFLPHSVFDIWRYPLFWLFGGSPNKETGSPSCELHLGDARWVIVTFGGVVFLAALALLPRWRKQRLAEPATGLFFAIGLAYMAWLAQFGIHRYMAPIDVLCGAAVLFLVLQLGRIDIKARLAMLAAILVLSGAVLKVPDFVHYPWRAQWRAIKPTPLDFGGPSIVFLTGKPMSYIAASLPADARYVGLVGDFDLRAGADNSLARQLKQMLATSPGARLKEVDQGSTPDKAAAILSGYGLAATSKCKDLIMPDETLRVCDVERVR
jgi:hypothetical protein